MNKNLIGEYLNESIIHLTPLSGGDINDVFKIETDKRSYVVKVNVADRFPAMFQKELNSLKELERSSFRIPQVFGTFCTDNVAYLIMEYIPSERWNPHSMARAGSCLATMHTNLRQDSFGFNEDNYIGSLPQLNTNKTSWSVFFVENRIEPTMRLAKDKRGIEFRNLSESRLVKHIENHFPRYMPCLLHGDLWSGNIFSDNSGNPVLIDPAVYYGIPEMDLGMTMLFGGFSADFYDSYQETNRLEKDWRDRADICNLYPLLVHVNLFGTGYIQQVQNIINRFFS